MQQLAKDDKIEAYVLPGGVAMQLFREIGAGRPGLFTHVGLGTFLDPRVDGGRMNKAAKTDLAEVVTIDGKELLRYKPFPVNVAMIRGALPTRTATSASTRSRPMSTSTRPRWPPTTAAAR